MKKHYILHFTISLLGLTILRMWWQNRLNLYVHPSLIWFIALGGVCIVFVALCWVRIRTVHLHLTNLQIISALGIVLLVALTRNTSLSPSLAKQRQNGEVVPQMNRAAIELTGVTSSFTVLEWWAAWESDPTHTKYIGSPVKVTGFILKNGDEHLVGRMLLTCCAVDAQPIQVAFLPLNDMPAENDWVEIEGSMGEKNGRPYILSTTIRQIDEPETPYVY